MTVIRTFLAALALLAGSTAAAPQTAPGGARAPQLFATADRCMACHNGLTTPSGEDVSIGVEWRSSMMANSSRDPYWHAAVRREILDHPAAQALIEDECSICHMPMARYQAKLRGRKGEVFAHLPIGRGDEPADRLAADGASCTACHQIQKDNLGKPESYTGGFTVEAGKPPGQRSIFGPFEVDRGHRRIMESASEFVPEQAVHIQSSEVCGTCHTLITEALGPGGEVVGRLAEQVPYLEWRHSAYRDSRGCQSCHMPEVGEPMPVTSVLGEPHAGFSRHAFRGSNFFMIGILHRYRDDLGVEAQPQELEASARDNVEHLETEAARVRIMSARVADGRLRADVEIENLAGHKLPTAYPSRRAWLRLTVLNRNGQTVFQSGGFKEDGSIQGNDNDADKDRYEPHYQEIDSPDKVQIYEAVMAGADGAVTTGLLTAVRYVKDNRILPGGFDKATAGSDIAVHGEAAQDPDFAAPRDRIRYSVPVSGADGPYSVRAELWYQPIAYRWARNLLQREAGEIRRFVSFYDSMSRSSAALLARDSARATP